MIRVKAMKDLVLGNRLRYTASLEPAKQSSIHYRVVCIKCNLCGECGVEWYAMTMFDQGRTNVILSSYCDFCPFSFYVVMLGIL